MPRPVSQAGPARRLRDAIEPLATHAFWNPLTNGEIRTHGLDRFSGYVWGRAAALGEPSSAVVVCAFAWFDPVELAAAYEAGRSKIPRSAMLALRERTTAASLAALLAGALLEPVTTVLQRGLEAAGDFGRPLYSGLRALDWPGSEAGRLWRACELIREHRGDSHILACAGEGMTPAEMNILTELWVGMAQGSYSATRRWDAAELTAAASTLEARGLIAKGSLTDAGRRLRDDLERRTDALEDPILEAIGDELEPALVQLGVWSQAVVEAGSFSRDPRKRAAG